jgi:hypothetical protein
LYYHLISKNLKSKIYKTLILPVVLYGYKTWSLTLREEYRLRVFENSVLRRMFGPKREEDGTQRKLHNDELHGLYSSANIVGDDYIREVGGICSMHSAGETFWLGGPKVRDHWKDTDVHEGIILRWTLRT